MTTWQPTEHPRIQILVMSGIGYKVRWETEVPRTRVRCPTCRKDLVPKDNGTPRKHECIPAVQERGYRHCRKAGKIRTFGTRSQAIAVALHESGITPAPAQIESRVLSGVPTVSHVI